MTAAAPATSAAPSATATSTKAGASIASLAGNFNDFLKLLMTQLQNQDPTSPMDTNQFTSQLVQFASVEQQINTNSSLTKLIQATQGSTLLQSSALVGQPIEVSGDQVALQAGKAALRFQSASAQPVAVGIYSQSGVKLRDASVNAVPGANTWSWDGRDGTGRVLPDGAYKAVVAGSDGAALSFTTLGTATGVQKVGDAMKVKLGSLQVDFSAVQSVGTKP